MITAEITDEDTQEFHNLVSKNVRKIRSDKGLTQLDVSLKLGFNNASYITNAESPNSDKKFNLTQLHKLSKIFDVNICEFFQDIK